MRKIIFILLLIFAGIGFVPTVKAQCPMCKSAVESSMKDKKSNKGKGLNKGILYLLSAPYLAVGLLGVGWYINSKKKHKSR